MSDASRAGVGMIGAGFISRYHLAGLRAAGARVPVVYSRRLDTARARAAEFGIEHATDRVDDVLTREDVDAVVIATPDATHEEMAAAAARAGKAVLVQKPMGVDPDQCRRMIDTARRHTVPLYVSFMHRHFEEVAALRRMLCDGRLGRITAVRVRNATPGADWAPWFYSRDQVGGGVLMQLGVHGIDLVQHLFGGITEVFAATRTTRTLRTLSDGTTVRPDNEDLALTTYRIGADLLASHECSYTEVAGTDRFRLEVYGEEGTVWLRSERGRLAWYDRARGTWDVPPSGPDDPGEAQHRHFLAMLGGVAPDDESAAAGLAATEVVAAAYRSADSGRWSEVRP